VTTPGVPDTGLIASGSKEFMVLSTVRRGNSASHLKPKFRVRSFVTLQSSCAKNDKYDARERILSDTRMLAAFTSPRRRLANALPVPETPGRPVISGLIVKLPADPRSRISSFAPARNSAPNFIAS